MTSIIVSGIPDICERKDLVEQFKTDYDHVLFPLGKDTTRALVVFKSQRAAEDALKKPLVIFGATLKTRPAPRQTYQQCTAHVDGLIVASMTDLQLCIRELQSEFGVDVNFSHESGSMVLTGSLLQIQCAQTKLDNIFREQQEAQARELLMVEQDLTTPRSHRSMAFTPQATQQMETGLSNTWTGSQVAPTQSQHEPSYSQQVVFEGSNHPRSSGTLSSTGWKSEMSRTPNSKSTTLRQSSGSLRDSGSLHKQSGRGHLNTGQAYRKEQSLSQEDGFTVKGVKIQRHSSKDQSAASTHSQERPLSQTGTFSELQVSSDAPPLRHTYAWGTSNSHSQAPPRVPSPKELVPPPEHKPEKLSKNGKNYLSMKLELELDVMGYIKKIHKAEVKEIEQKHHVQFSNRWSDGVMEVRITTPLSEEEGSLDKLSAARQDFVSFYQTIYYSVVKDIVTYKPSRIPVSEVDAVTTAVGKAFASRVYVNSTNPGEIILVGSYEYLPLVKDWVNKKMAEVKVTYKGQTTKAGAVSRRDSREQKASITTVKTQSRGGVGIPEKERSDKAAQHMNGLPPVLTSPVFKHKTREGLEVLIYKADITQVKTQAIVNASNDNLRHIGAIALAISEAAGPQLQEECTEYINQNGPMRVSEVMSTPGGGRLYCDHVIHSVGPMWCLYTDKKRCGDALRQTFLNTLYYANNKLKVASLTTPAISSGVYGVPLDVCTQALYSAIQAFSPAATTLKQVHVVDLEEDAAGMMSIIFQQLAEGEGLHSAESNSQETQQLRVEDIEAEEGALQEHQDREIDFPKKEEALIQPSRMEMELASAPPRLEGQESSDWPDSPPPSPTQRVIQDREVYSGALDDSDYEEPIQEEVIRPSKVKDVHSAVEFNFDDFFHELDRSHHSQQPSKEASFNSVTSAQQEVSGKQKQDYQSPRQQEYQSPRQQAQRSPNCSNISGLMSPHSGHLTPTRSGQVTPKSMTDMLETNRSGLITPRSGQMTPRSGQATPRSGHIVSMSGQATPKSDHMASRSDHHRALSSGEVTPRPDQMVSRSGQETPRSGQTTPRSDYGALMSGQATPKSDHMTLRSGQATPTSGQATPRSDRMASRSGQATPKSDQTPSRSGQITPRSDHIDLRSGQTTPRSDRILPRSGPDTADSGQATPRADQVSQGSGHVTPRSGHFTPRSGKMTPRSGQVTPRRSGQTSPKSIHLLQDVQLDSLRSGGTLTPHSHVGIGSQRSGPEDPAFGSWQQAEEATVDAQTVSDMFSQPPPVISPSDQPIVPNSTPAVESAPWSPDNSRQSSAMQESIPDTETQLLKLAHQKQKPTDMEHSQTLENQPIRPKTPESTLSEMFSQSPTDRVPLLIRLVASAICIAEKGGEIIRNILKAGDLGIVQKTGINDLQTEADRSANTSIVMSLRRQFVGVKVIGEEDEEEEKEVPADWLESSQSVDVLQYAREVPDDLRDIESQDVVIWVDPLDGTSEYTQGLLDHVTVLIGISVKGKAVGGIIHQPYYNYLQGPDATLGRTIWGIIGVGAFGFTLTPPPTGSNIVCTTRSHSNRHVNLAVDSCQPTEILRVGGSGHKVLLLLEGVAHAYVFASPGTKKWDTCGPEAILHAVGGKLTDMHGNYYSYDERTSKKNSGGVLATVGTEEHQVYLALIPQEVKAELPTDGPAVWQMAQQITDRLQHIQVPLVLRILASAVSVSERAGEIVREIMKQGELGIVEKGVNDLQTEADRSAQACIVGSLRKHFPDLSVIGEEGEECSEGRAEWLHSNQSEEVLQCSGRVPERLRDVIDEDVTVWVDPLDGTAEYTQGLLDHVTVLVGVSVRGQAVAGVIYQPFYNYQSGPDAPLGRTIWGMVGIGSFGFTRCSLPEDQNIICTTRSHSNKNVNMAVESCNPTEVLRVGGSGHKVLLLLEGLAHAYVFASPGTKKWDTCAPEAILHASGGKLTDLHGNQYQYGSGVEKKNKGGVLATAQSVPHGRYLQAIPDQVKSELPSD